MDEKQFGWTRSSLNGREAAWMDKKQPGWTRSNLARREVPWLDEKRYREKSRTARNWGLVIDQGTVNFEWREGCRGDAGHPGAETMHGQVCRAHVYILPCTLL